MEKVTKTAEWAKTALGFTENELAKLRKDGIKAIYACSVYPSGGGDDKIYVSYARKIVQTDKLDKVFTRKSLGGQIFGDMVEVEL